MKHVNEIRGSALPSVGLLVVQSEATEFTSAEFHPPRNVTA